MIASTASKNLFHAFAASVVRNSSSWDLFTTTERSLTAFSSLVSLSSVVAIPGGYARGLLVTDWSQIGHDSGGVANPSARRKGDLSRENGSR